MDRYWINQPSTLQPLNRYHGLRVIAPRDLPKDWVTVYPADGDVISLIAPPQALSSGWPTRSR